MDSTNFCGLKTSFWFSMPWIANFIFSSLFSWWNKNQKDNAIQSARQLSELAKRWDFSTALGVYIVWCIGNLIANYVNCYWSFAMNSILYPSFLFKEVARLWTKWKISPVFLFLLLRIMNGIGEILCQPILLIENYEWYKRDPMVKLMVILAPSCLPLWWLRWCKGGVEFAVGFRLGPRVRYFQTKLKAMFTNLLITVYL